MALYLFIAPWALGFLLLTLLPIGMGILTSLTNYDGISPLNLVKFVGVQNYVRAFQDEEAWGAFGNVAVLSLWLVPIGMVVSTTLAVLLNQDVKGKGVFRTIYYLPTVFPIVAGATLWITIADKNAGLLNAVLSVFRPGTAVNWLLQYTRLILSLFVIWSGTGGGMIIMLAGLQGIPQELKDAARIDGANSWRTFVHITLPLLTPVIFFQLIMSLIGTLQIYVQPILMTPATRGATTTGLAGIPRRPVYMYLNHVMIRLLAYQQFGYGTALLWIMFVILVLLTLGVFRTSRYWVYYEVEQG
jgi:multiple sugar transport system permease protein